jgi:hypothetical protein
MTSFFHDRPLTVIFFAIVICLSAWNIVAPKEAKTDQVFTEIPEGMRAYSGMSYDEQDPECIDFLDGADPDAPQ